MEIFREKYKRVVFVYVSDDIAWAKEKLGKKPEIVAWCITTFYFTTSEKRIKTKDFYIAGALIDPKMAGNDII